MGAPRMQSQARALERYVLFELLERLGGELGGHEFDGKYENVKGGRELLHRGIAWGDTDISVVRQVAPTVVSLTPISAQSAPTRLAEPSGPSKETK